MRAFRSVPNQHVRGGGAVRALPRLTQHEAGVCGQHGDEPTANQRIARYHDGGGAKRSVQVEERKTWTGFVHAPPERLGAPSPFDRFCERSDVAKLWA